MAGKFSHAKQAHPHFSKCIMAPVFTRLMPSGSELMVCVIDHVLSRLTVRFQQLQQRSAPRIKEFILLELGLAVAV